MADEFQDAHKATEYPAPSWPLENQSEYPRPWLFMPGDKVICLLPTVDHKLLLVGGVVQRIQIPGPIREEKTVYVMLDEDGPLKLGWWDPNDVERIHG